MRQKGQIRGDKDVRVRGDKRSQGTPVRGAIGRQGCSARQQDQQIDRKHRNGQPVFPKGRVHEARANPEQERRNHLVVIKDVVSRIQTEDQNHEECIAKQAQAGQVSPQAEQRLMELMPIDPPNPVALLHFAYFGPAAEQAVDQARHENEYQSRILCQERAADPSQVCPTSTGGRQHGEESLRKIAFVNESGGPDRGQESEAGHRPK